MYCLFQTHIYGGILLYMPIYIEILSPISMQCTVDWETGMSYSSSKYNSIKYDSNQMDWLRNGWIIAIGYGAVSCTLCTILM